ncbi:MAG: hypothetical protein GY822_12295 [Deltaproteobacteria bacterium]|nr:hypothetical protein [Deltaproteobacteria bacterium]
MNAKYVVTVSFLVCALGCNAPLDVCGDGELSTSEACEEFDLRGETCASQGYDEGTLRCTDSCELDLEVCSTCGDGIIGGEEICDEDELAGNRCDTLGYLRGSLSCRSDCSEFIEFRCEGGPGDPCVNGQCGDNSFCLRQFDAQVCAGYCNTTEDCGLFEECRRLESEESTYICAPTETGAAGFFKYCSLQCLPDGCVACPSPEFCMSEADQKFGQCTRP